MNRIAQAPSSTTPDSTQATTSSPIDQLAAVFERWVSNPIRGNVTIEGVRLLQVMRLLARPVYNLTELHAKAEQAAKVAAWDGGLHVEDRKQAARAAAKAVDDAYSAILRDVDTLFTALTGVPAHTLDALNLRVPAKQLAEDTRTLLAVNV
ncbi:hypothetical protein ACF1GW_38710 [Streptomyces achromogenes]|uniref:hypothetical protein n=1 Tax=Streptomyces achromogenes TaxID=67255 RepID=UPI0036FBA58D